MKPIIEKVPQRLGASWRYKKINEANKAHEWHVHDEYELVLHRHFQGNAYLGHFQGKITHNNLILISPKTPHMFDSEGNNGAICETHVFWFKPDWIANMMINSIELRRIESLLKRAGKSLVFSTQTAEHVFELVDNLLNKSAITQLTILLQILDILCDDKTSQTLQSYARVPTQINPSDRNKLNKICAYVDKNHNKIISLRDIAQYMYISESTIQRIFSTHFHESFCQYLKKYRLNHATELLTSTDMAINLIAEKVGYRNQANFNRQFKAYKKHTPREYRKAFKLAVI